MWLSIATLNNHRVYIYILLLLGNGAEMMNYGQYNIISYIYMLKCDQYSHSSTYDIWNLIYLTSWLGCIPIVYSSYIHHFWMAAIGNTWQQWLGTSCKEGLPSSSTIPASINILILEIHQQQKSKPTWIETHLYM